MINIAVYFNEEKNNNKFLISFQENWKQEIIESTDDEGHEVMFKTGLSDKLSEVPVTFIPITKGAERVTLVNGRRYDAPLFTLEGPKALQTQVLQDYLTGLLKRQK